MNYPAPPWARHLRPTGMRRYLEARTALTQNPVAPMPGGTGFFLTCSTFSKAPYIKKERSNTLNFRRGLSLVLATGLLLSGGGVAAAAVIAAPAYATTVAPEAPAAKDPASTVKVSVPKSLKASATTSSVTASWGKPAVTGKLTGYTVTLKQGSKTVKTYTTTRTSQSFTKLKDNTSYKVYVKANAVSADGKDGKSSSTVSKAVKTVSASVVKVAKPGSVKTSAGTNTVAFSWKKPAVTGKITGYTVTLKKGSKTVTLTRGSKKMKSYTTIRTKVTFTNLKPNTTYRVYVKANAKSINGKHRKSSSTVAKTVKTMKAPLRGGSVFGPGAPGVSDFCWTVDKRGAQIPCPGYAI